MAGSWGKEFNLPYTRCRPCQKSPARIKVIAFSGQATTQRPLAWQASSAGVSAVLRPLARDFSFPKNDSAP